MSKLTTLEQAINKYEKIRKYKDINVLVEKLNKSIDLDLGYDNNHE